MVKNNQKDKAKKYTILIVDDEVEIVEELKEILESEGYLTLAAFNGVEAVKIFSEKESCDLVLLDIVMPKMSGVETYFKLRKINPKVPIVIVTGSFAKRNAGRLLEYGANDVIYKPFNKVEELLEVIKKNLAGEKKVKK